MREVARMAGSITGCLNFTYDCPSYGKEGQVEKTMAVLDCQMWVGVESREVGIPPRALEDPSLRTTRTGELHQVILYEFYKKPMSNRTPNLAHSAIPESMKVSTASGEILRRLKNTSRDLPPGRIEGVLKTYMQELKEGGFPQAWREDALLSAVTGYERMWRKEVEGKGRLNRPAHTTVVGRRWKRLIGRTRWFQPDGSRERQGPVKRKRAQCKEDMSQKRVKRRPLWRGSSSSPILQAVH